MSDFAATPKVVSPGITLGDFVIVEHELTSALANLDTVTLTLPTGVADDLVPLLCDAWSNADPRVKQTNIALTSHDKDTGVTILTASGAVADSSTIRVVYAPCKLGT